MKKIGKFITIAILLTSAACSSTNKSGNDANNSDTAAYNGQPTDKTQVNDTLLLQNPDSLLK